MLDDLTISLHDCGHGQIITRAVFKSNEEHLGKFTRMKHEKEWENIMQSLEDNLEAKEE